MSTHQLIGRWGSYIKRHYSANTVLKYKAIIWRFAEFAPENPQYLTAEHIEMYLDSLIGLSNRSKNSHIACIKSFCRWRADNYELPNPKIKKLPENPPKQRFLNDEEYNKVLAICTPQERNTLEFLSNTGLRVSEFLSLSEGNISQDKRLLYVVGKGNRQRAVPLNQKCRDILDSTTIDLLKSKCHCRVALYKLCCRLAVRAAISRFGPHALRHRFATLLMKKNVPLAKISKILGHSSTAITERIYVHWCVSDIVGVTDVLD